MTANFSNFIGAKLLIVDDDPDLRSTLILEFKKRGCTIFEAGSGHEAIDVIRNHAIDLVLSDVRMPNGNGVELLENIRKIHPKIPAVLLLTGFADLTQEEAIRKGASDLIEKPIDRKKMLSLAALVLEGHEGVS